jgi:hypothetical protein
MEVKFKKISPLHYTTAPTELKKREKENPRTTKKLSHINVWVQMVHW